MAVQSQSSRRYHLVLFWIFCLSCVPCVAAYTISVTPDRPLTMYAINQEIRFHVRVRQDDAAVTQGAITFLLDTGGPVARSTGTAALSTEPIVIATASGTPGIVRCHATYTFNAALSVSTVAVVGVALEQLRPSMATPADFDAYWQAQRAQLAAVPMTVTARPVPQANPQLVCQDVSVACQPGKAVRGYLSRPANAAPRSLPAVLWLPFAGVSGANQYQSLRGAEWGALSLSINIFGIENDLSTQAYAQMEQGPFKHYPHQGREHRDTYFFHDAFLMSWRALDYLTAQPEWNGKILAVFGSSQGGALAFVAGGFDPRVTLIAAAVPAMCDHTAPAVGRMVAWPQLIPHTPDGAPDARVTTTARYYDVVNFASRCTAPALVSVGFLDIASPPTSVYAAYNAIPGAKKQIMNEWTRGHECSEEFDQLFRRTLFPEAK